MSGVRKSVSAHWSANWQIKKTPESRNSVGDGEPGGKTNLRDDYEQLREYFLSPAKTPSRPLGLDLWFKKGFLAWIAGVFSGESPMEPALRSHVHTGNFDVPAGLLMPLVNILMDWGDKNGGQQNQKRAHKP
jgi:hypothetical protein